MDVQILRLDRQSFPEPHLLPPAPRVSLEITRGRVRQRTRPIAGKVFLIGAASDCDLVLGDLQFPEAYAYIFVSGTEVSIRRLGSGPTLVVCGDKVETADLYHGDLIEMGPFELRVVIDHPPRRGGTDDHDRAWQRPELDDDSDEQSAIDEVRSLLADIRQALAEDSASIRLHYEPDPDMEDAEECPSPVHQAIARRRATA
jgi:pSer/pThr/pTyr-binding forkhead associated (FHA) protein